MVLLLGDSLLGELLTLVRRPAWPLRDLSSRSRAAFSICTFVLSCTAAFSFVSTAASFSLHSHTALLSVSPKARTFVGTGNLILNVKIAVTLGSPHSAVHYS